MEKTFTESQVRAILFEQMEFTSNVIYDSLLKWFLTKDGFTDLESKVDMTSLKSLLANSSIIIESLDKHLDKGCITDPVGTVQFLGILVEHIAQVTNTVLEGLEIKGGINVKCINADVSGNLTLPSGVISEISSKALTQVASQLRKGNLTGSKEDVLGGHNFKLSWTESNVTLSITVGDEQAIINLTEQSGGKLIEQFNEDVNSSEANKTVH